jgi:hypothetical protein
VLRMAPSISKTLGFIILSAGKELSRHKHYGNGCVCGAGPREIPVSNGGIAEESMRPQSIRATHSQ